MLRKYLPAIFLLFCTIHSFAQVQYLRLSPSQTLTQRVGATDLTIEYSRPQIKGRKIFGSLVPYGKFWRTGANENTTVEFDHRIKIGDTEVDAGKYSLITKPSLGEWEIYFYTETNNLDVPNPVDKTKLIYLTTVPARQLNSSEETLVINIYDITETTAYLGIRWEQTEVRVPILFYTREAMQKQIDQALKQNIMDYNITASYYSQRGIELEKAKKIQELVMELKDQPSLWDYHNYGIILQKLGDKKAAIKNLKTSLELAKEKKNDYLIKENERILKEVNN